MVANEIKITAKVTKLPIIQPIIANLVCWLSFVYKWTNIIPRMPPQKPQIKDGTPIGGPLGLDDKIMLVFELSETLASIRFALFSVFKT